jgi:hypothetical protein
VAGTHYPTLRKIAYGIFSIPVSTVASECAFSTCGRILSEHCSRLTPKNLEVLMSSQDWIKTIIKVYICTTLSAFRTHEDPQPTSEFVAACPCPDGLMQDGTQEGG